MSDELDQHSEQGQPPAQEPQPEQQHAPVREPPPESEFVFTTTPPLRRRPAGRKTVFERRHGNGWAFWVVCAILIGLAAVWYVKRPHLSFFAIVENGKPLVALDSEDAALQAIQLVKTNRAPDAPEAITFAEGEPTVKKLKKAMTSHSVKDAAAILERKLTVVCDGYAFYVNHRPLVMVPKSDVAKTISLMQQRGLNGNPGVPTFKEKVTVNHLHLTKDSKEQVPVMSGAKAAEFLVHPPLKRIYTVDNGDNFWKIATAIGITVDDLKKLNPDVDYQRLHKGDQVKLPDEPAPVTVVVRNAPPPEPDTKKAKVAEPTENYGPGNPDTADTPSSPAPTTDAGDTGDADTGDAANQ